MVKLDQFQDTHLLPEHQSQHNYIFIFLIKTVITSAAIGNAESLCNVHHNTKLRKIGSDCFVFIPVVT